MKLASEASILEDLRGWINNRILRDPGSGLNVLSLLSTWPASPPALPRTSWPSTWVCRNTPRVSLEGDSIPLFCFRYCVVWCFKPVDGEYWRTYIFAYSWTFTYTKRQKPSYIYLHTCRHSHTQTSTHKHRHIHHTFTHLHTHTLSCTHLLIHNYKHTHSQTIHLFFHLQLFFTKSIHPHITMTYNNTVSTQKRIINSQESNRNLIHRRVVLVDHPPGQQAEVWGREGSSRWRPHSCVCCHRAISGWYF